LHFEPEIFGKDFCGLAKFISEKAEEQKAIEPEAKNIKVRRRRYFDIAKAVFAVGFVKWLFCGGAVSGGPCLPALEHCRIPAILGRKHQPDTRHKPSLK